MTAIIAQRRDMHGPLWTAEDGRTRIQLWAPNHERTDWALGWTTTDEDGEVVDSEHLRRPDLAAFPALVPSHLRRPVAAVLNAASAWNPAEECDHTRAMSFKQLDAVGAHLVCGYCGRDFHREQGH